MTVLVTGGCGLVGSFIVRELVKRGERPVAYDLVLKTDLFQDILPSVTLVRGDVLDLPDLMRAIEEHGVDRILHTASFLTPGVYARPYAGVKTNIMGALNVFEAARLSKVKRTTFSSTGKTRIVGKQYAEAVTTGEWEIEPDPYTTTKVACELLVNDYRGMYDMDVRVVRYNGQIYGPGYGFGGGLGQAFEVVMGKILRGEPVRLVRSAEEGDYRLPERIGMLYCRDAAHGTVLAGFTDSPSPEFNVPAFESATLPQIGATLQELLPDSKIETGSSALQGGPTPVDARARDELGYTPRYNLRDGLKEYVSYLQSSRLIYEEPSA
jgi:nucleoside-diphosphate-sugar epimerase